MGECALGRSETPAQREPPGSMTAVGGHYRAGQRFGPYTIEAFLGSGAYKSVYRARYEPATGSDSAEPLNLPPTVALGFPHAQDPAGTIELRKEFTVVS